MSVHTERNVLELAHTLGALCDEVDELRARFDAIAARQEQRPAEVADAVVLQLAPKLDAAKRASRLSRRSR